MLSTDKKAVVLEVSAQMSWATSFSLLLQAAASATASPAPEPGVLLWQTLREGMSADEAASALRALDGIKSVTVKTTRKGQSLSIGYAAQGLDVDGLIYKVAPVFEANLLTTITL